MAKSVGRRKNGFFHGFSSRHPCEPQRDILILWMWVEGPYYTVELEQQVRLKDLLTLIRVHPYR